MNDFYKNMRTMDTMRLAQGRLHSQIQSPIGLSGNH
jgi:hypothetical protein